LFAAVLPPQQTAGAKRAVANTPGISPAAYLSLGGGNFDNRGSHHEHQAGNNCAAHACSRRNVGLVPLILAPKKAGHIVPKDEAIAPKGNGQNQSCRMGWQLRRGPPPDPPPTLAKVRAPFSGARTVLPWGQRGRARTEQMFSALPPKADLRSPHLRVRALAIDRTLPSLSFGQSPGRHRSRGRSGQGRQRCDGSRLCS
jgi:hypothetical protein